MTDKFGKELNVGDRVVYVGKSFGGNETGKVLVVRKIKDKACGGNATRARCDDGDPASDDLLSNNYTFSTWSPSSELAKV